MLPTHGVVDLVGGAWRPLPPLVVRALADDFTIRHTHRLATTTVTVLELPPRVRAIHFVAGGMMHEFRVSLPYQFFVLEFTQWIRWTFSSAHAFYRTSPLQGPESMLYRCNLPNMLHADQVCMGDTADLAQNVSRATSPSDFARAFLSDFWNRPFSNEALTPFRESATLHPAFESLASWEAASRRDPGFVLRVPWTPVGTLDHHLRRLDGGFSL